MIVLCFRGTEQKVQDWATNLNGQQITVEGIEVHGGFWEAFQSVKRVIIDDITPLIEEGYTLYITGHSLGGALALIRHPRNWQ